MCWATWPNHQNYCWHYISTNHLKSLHLSIIIYYYLLKHFISVGNGEGLVRFHTKKGVGLSNMYALLVCLEYKSVLIHMLAIKSFIFIYCMSMILSRVFSAGVVVRVGIVIVRYIKNCFLFKIWAGRLTTSIYHVLCIQTVTGNRAPAQANLHVNTFELLKKRNRNVF